MNTCKGHRDGETDWILDILWVFFFGTFQDISFFIFLNVPTFLLSNNHSTPQTLLSKIHTLILPLSPSLLFMVLLRY